MENKFTLAPWYIDGEHICANSGNMQTNETICDLNPSTEYNTVYERSPTESKGNARLIAAAPDLLQACLDALDAQTTKEIEQAKKACYLAINKALNK